MIKINSSSNNEQKDDVEFGVKNAAFSDLSSYPNGELADVVIVPSEKPPLDDDKVAQKENTEQPEEDPWAIIDTPDDSPKWKDLSTVQRIWKVCWLVARICLVFGLLYFFICSLDILQDAFQLLGGRAAGNVFTQDALINNPVCGLMIGVVVTVLVQSSSTSTSIIVSMVGSGLISVQQAIPMVMGANIGTTVTNTLVALTQSMDRNMFRRAFAGATVHDMFNWLTVLILLPLEVASGYLYHLTEAMTQNVVSTDSDTPQFLKVITQPLTKLIIQIDKKVITAIAHGTDRMKFPLIKYYCKEVDEDYVEYFPPDDVNMTFFNTINEKIFTTDVRIVNNTNETSIRWTEVLDANSTKCTHLFVGCGLPGAPLGEVAVGIILLIGSLTVMIICLVLSVKILNSLFRGPMANLIKKYINADFPGCFSFLTGYVAMLIGAGITVLVQSSSVFTSTLTPLVGIGVVTVERVYPLTLGSNIGTTVTSVFAALTADANMVKYTLQIALCHLFFNISGIIIFYPIPFMRRIPIQLAKNLGATTANHRWFAIVYLIGMYIILPVSVFALSLAGWYVLVAVGVPIFFVLAVVVIINIIQSKRPQWLPKWLCTWKFLPEPLRSLYPYERAAIICCFHRDGTARCKCCSKFHVNRKAPESIDGMTTTSCRFTTTDESDLSSSRDLSQDNVAFDSDSRIENFYEHHTKL